MAQVFKQEQIRILLSKTEKDRILTKACYEYIEEEMQNDLHRWQADVQINESGEAHVIFQKSQERL